MQYLPDLQLESASFRSIYESIRLSPLPSNQAHIGCPSISVSLFIPVLLVPAQRPHFPPFPVSSQSPHLSPRLPAPSRCPVVTPCFNLTDLRSCKVVQVVLYNVHMYLPFGWMSGFLSGGSKKICMDSQLHMCLWVT